MQYHFLKLGKNFIQFIHNHSCLLPPPCRISLFPTNLVAISSHRCLAPANEPDLLHSKYNSRNAISGSLENWFAKKFACKKGLTLLQKFSFEAYT